MGGGGTKLGLIRPWRTRSAVHSASLTSVRHGLDVMGVGDDQLEVAFQDRMDRLPINPGALHADMRDTQLLELLPHRLQILRHRRKRPDLLMRLAAGLADQHTGDHRRLMDVETGTAFDDRIHHLLHEKLLPWRSPHRTSTTEARADPNRVATLGDAWMRCRSISCAGWITCQNPTSLRSPP